MAKNISEKDVYPAVAEVMHPAIDRTLVELGMIRNITVGNNRATLTLVLPSPNVPIKDIL